MKWKRIPKELRAGKVRAGTYRQWKPELSSEGFCRCVYCALPDNRFGGQYNFHVEHFKPRKRAPELANEWSNLFYACAICNVFKGMDWPEPNSQLAFPDPSRVDFETLFERAGDGQLVGHTPAARYLIEKLFLNRPQLVLERRYASVIEQLLATRAALQRLEEVVDEHAAWLMPALQDAFRIERHLMGVLLKLQNVALYAHGDVRRGGK